MEDSEVMGVQIIQVMDEHDLSILIIHDLVLKHIETYGFNLPSSHDLRLPAPCAPRRGSVAASAARQRPGRRAMSMRLGARRPAASLNAKVLQFQEGKMNEIPLNHYIYKIRLNPIKSL